MLAPLGILAVLAVVGGYKGLYPRVFAGVIEKVPEAEGASYGIVLATSLIVLLAGAAVAFGLYSSAAIGRSSAAAGAGALIDPFETKFPGLFAGIRALRDVFDNVYDYYVAKIQQRIAMLLNFIDRLGIGGLIRGLAGLVGLLGLQARAMYVGRLNAYLYWFLAGVAVLWAFAAGIF
jgi:NADH-quinone oxidoreductase subunit L